MAQYWDYFYNETGNKISFKIFRDDRDKYGGCKRFASSYNLIPSGRTDRSGTTSQYGAGKNVDGRRIVGCVRYLDKLKDTDTKKKSTEPQPKPLPPIVVEDDKCRDKAKEVLKKKIKRSGDICRDAEIIRDNAQIQVTAGECGGFVANNLTVVNTQIQIDCNPDATGAIQLEGGNFVSRLGE